MIQNIELLKQLEEKKKQINSSRMSFISGKPEALKEYRNLKKEVARLLTGENASQKRKD